MGVFAFESGLLTVLLLVMTAIELFAFVDALLRPAPAFVAAGKLTKPAWLLILAIGLVSALLFRSPMGILGLVGIIAAGVYLADVRPAVAAMGRR